MRARTALQTARRYKTVIHCLAARRHAPTNPDLAAQIRRAETPAEAAALAGAPTEQNDARRIAECRAATLAKCQQNKHISARLLATGSAPIVVVGGDPFWEAAEPASASGNALGRVLMDVRLELQEQAVLEERRAGSVAHTIGAGLVALGLGIATVRHTNTCFLLSHLPIQTYCVSVCLRPAARQLMTRAM